MEYKIILVLATVFVFVPYTSASCASSLLQDKELLRCSMALGQKITEKGITPTDSAQVMHLICSDKEAQTNYVCVTRRTMELVKNCPELMGGSGNPIMGLLSGFDIGDFLNEGGMDGICAMSTGPCNVLHCLTQSNARVKRDTRSSIQYFRLFDIWAKQQCGPQKAQTLCVLNVLESCPPDMAKKVQSYLNKAIKLSLPEVGSMGNYSFEMSKEFIEKECSNIPTGTCSDRVFQSSSFTNCNSHVIETYTNSTNRTCELYEMSKSCLLSTLLPTCGKSTTNFYLRNLHLVFPGIPSDCVSEIGLNKKDSEKPPTDGSVNSQQLSVLLLFLTVLFAVFG